MEEAGFVSYIRFGEGGSDLYVYSDGEQFHCCGCLFKTRDTGDAFASAVFATREDILQHLLDHREEGHVVPDAAIERLQAEIEGKPYQTDVEKELKDLQDMLNQHRNRKD